LDTKSIKQQILAQKYSFFTLLQFIKVKLLTKIVNFYIFLTLKIKIFTKNFKNFHKSQVLPLATLKKYSYISAHLNFHLFFKRQDKLWQIRP